MELRGKLKAAGTILGIVAAISGVLAVAFFFYAGYSIFFFDSAKISVNIAVTLTVVFYALSIGCMIAIVIFAIISRIRARRASRKTLNENK